MVEDYTVMRGGLSSSTGRNCEIVNSVGHGNQEKGRVEVREFQKPLAVATMIRS